jgi:formamidase
VAVKGWAQDCPYTYMHDMAAGQYKLPWGVQVTDGTSCGFAAPTRGYAGPQTTADALLPHASDLLNKAT